MKIKAINLTLLSLSILLMGCKDDSTSSKKDNNPYLGVWEYVGYIDEGEQFDNEGDVYYSHITENKITDYD
jgi:hypothetical protein